ncbi:hypothetical protein QTN47_26955 [Danxiaibacter flavus]|uniref:Uncharacterized protein n=1 Tax=Danxiaibacter flavus TaxID=3049108 RepID=A0ABV3ZMV9_9BACT|nr:hypothetical protein QNM32_26955 [Chitinophagaceae bacterium DXS]
MSDTGLTTNTGITDHAGNSGDNFVVATTTEQDYIIPLRYRKMENLHIVFWLFKDVSWCLVWKPLGIAMIFPTLIISIVIAYRTRQYVSELCHNLAITIWISANSYWMISEFLHFDEHIVFGNITFKHLTLIPFGLGILILAYFYLYWQPRHKNEI